MFPVHTIQDGTVQSPTPEKLGRIARLRGGSVEPVKAFEVRPDYTTVLREAWYWAAHRVLDV